MKNQKILKEDLKQFNLPAEGLKKAMSWCAGMNGYCFKDQSCSHQTSDFFHFLLLFLYQMSHY